MLQVLYDLSIIRDRSQLFISAVGAVNDLEYEEAKAKYCLRSLNVSTHNITEVAEENSQILC